MTDEHSDDDRRADGDASTEGGRVLSPEELDISSSEYVSELDQEGRYVVSAGGGAPEVPDDRSGVDASSADASDAETGDGADAAPEPASDTSSTGAGGIVSPEAARSLLSEELSRNDAGYGVDIVARFEGEPVRHRTVSNDVVATFEQLVRWYARHVADDTPTDEVVDILFREADLSRPTETPDLASLLEGHDLSPDDSIAEMVEAIREEAAGD